MSGLGASDDAVGQPGQEYPRRLTLWTSEPGEGDPMQLDDDTTAATLPRLKRAQGQLAAVIRMLEEGRDCQDVVTQLAAVSRALDRAGYKMLAGGLRQCLAAEAEGRPSGMTPEQMEKLFLSLA
jgi:DNA-binding FrmR family transcriptional regulator